MIFKKFLKSLSIILCTILISISSVSISHAHNHSPKWEKINELKVSDKTLADQRVAQDKEAEERFKSELNDYIERIEETEDAINNLRVEVGESAFPTQIDLLNGFFGGAEDIIAEATKRFGADSSLLRV